MKRKVKETKRLVVGGVISQFYVVVDNLDFSVALQPDMGGPKPFQLIYVILVEAL